MAARKKQSQINLLPQEEFAASTGGRILQWLLTSFRIIVIFTELIVMGAFISRFFLDARSNDLTDMIEGKKAVIKSFYAFERQFKSTQQRIAIFSTLTDSSKNIAPVVTNIQSSLPDDITLTSIDYHQNIYTLKGNSFTEKSIAQLIANLRALNFFTKISLVDLDMGGETPYTSFSISMEKGS